MSPPPSLAAGSPARAAPTQLTWVPLLAAVFVVSTNLRASIAAVPPLITVIENDLGLTGAQAGLLTSLPVACMGLLAPAASRVVHAAGREGAVVLALSLVLAGNLVRLGGGAVPALYAGTALAGAGIALAGVVLPGIVKHSFSTRPGAATGVYMAGMTVGATAAAGLAVPLASTLGSWQLSVAFWALPAGAALLVWWPVARRREAPERRAARPGASTRAPRLPWRSRTAWVLGSYLALQSTLFYACLAWLPPLYESHGWTPQQAGLLLALSTAVQVVSGLAAPVLSDRSVDRRPMIAMAVAASLTGLVLMTVAPEAAPWLAAVLLGLGLGAGFPLGLVLIVDYGGDAAAASRLTGMVFLISYGVASLGPTWVGALRDASGGLVLAFAVLTGVCLAQAATVPALRPDRTKVAG